MTSFRRIAPVVLAPLFLLIVAAAPKPPAPRLVFQKIEHNFGSVVQGTKVRHTFTIYNKGSVPLQISAVTNECPCFRVISFNKTLGIDGQGMINVEVDTTGMEGPLYITPVVVSNSRNPKAKFLIRGTIEGPVALGPKSNYALSMIKGEQKSVELLVKNNRPAPMKIRGVASSDPSFTARVIDDVPGQKYKVIATSNPKVSLGHHKATITIQTDAPERSQLTANIDLLVFPSVVAKPETLLLPVMTQAEARQGSGKKTWSLELSDVKGRPFRIVKTKADSYLRVSAKESRDGKTHELLVGLNPNAVLKPGTTKVDLDVMTNLATAPVVRIPVTISVRVPG
jgi:hypothetical protein